MTEFVNLKICKTQEPTKFYSRDYSPIPTVEAVHIFIEHPVVMQAYREYEAPESNFCNGSLHVPPSVVPMLIKELQRFMDEDKEAQLTSLSYETMITGEMTFERPAV